MDIDTGVDMRLLRVRGRAELALLIVTWPAADNPAAGSWLEDLEPQLADFAAVGDVFELVVVLRSADRTVVTVQQDANMPALERIVSLRSVPVTALIDGLVGEPVERIASRCQRVVRGRSARDAIVSGPNALPMRIDTKLTGNELIDAVVRMVRSEGSALDGAASGYSGAEFSPQAGRLTGFAGAGASR